MPTTLAEWLAACGDQAAIAFTDVVGSTQLLFDRQTMEFENLLEAHRAQVEVLTHEFGGRIIEITSDATFAAFPSVAPACRYVLSLHQDCGSPQLGVRCGVHIGAVQVRDGILVGRNVYYAARVRDHGSGAEVWLSEEARVAVTEEDPAFAAGLSFSHHEVCDLKGVPDPKTLWRIV
ncbi:MAG: adenylate/guanylate cyclase domain-containing protein [Pseudomonadota bacterium]